MPDPVVRVRTTIAQKRPIATHFFDAREIHLGDGQRLLLAGCGHDDAERVADERVTPELDPRALTAQLLKADAVHRRDPAAIGDRVAALDRSPRIELLRAVLLLLGGMPADGGRIQEDICALQRRQAGSLRVPLIPTDHRADGADFGVKGAEAEVAGREIELLVVGWVIG